MELSIIVPVYNVEYYLDKCISSLFCQDINPNSYEVITVNDGSTDNSLNKLEELKKTYPSIKIITQQNQGLSGARNTGLNHASGEYVLFVDSDDYILENTLKSLLSIVQEYNLDILEFAAKGISEDGKTVYISKNSSQGKVLSGETYISEITYMSSACNKLYKMSFLNKNQFRFMEGVYIEDIEFNTRVVYKASKVMAIDAVIACFLKREGSITRTSSFLKTKKMIYDIHKVLSSINDFNEFTVTKTSVAYVPLKRRTCGLITTMLLRVLTGINDYNIKKDIFKKLKSQNLYPIPYKTGDKNKDRFRLLSNVNLLFSLICKMNCVINKQK